ncbi:MAG: sulfate ABC transporter permease subunit CysW [Sinobacteraceae bacterium]|nr:sulfate ABC transporter permease subunit CysW [Nevskiaceae bacterium]
MSTRTLEAPPLAQTNAAIDEPRWVRHLLMAVALSFLATFLLLPLGQVLFSAFAKGTGAWWAAVTDPDSRAAIRMSLLTATLAVAANTLFGLCAAWAIAYFHFPGKRWLVTLIDLPFSVSPVIAGLIFILIFGARGWAGPWLIEHGIRIVFAWPGMVLATTFVTFPFVARALIPLLQQKGSQHEEAALTLGASGWRMFWQVSLPKMRWALLYGVLLCNARAMGEFGAVSVVSGHIRGRTNTMPLQVELFYNDYRFEAAFALASLLAALALLTMGLKAFLEWHLRDELAATRGH